MRTTFTSVPLLSSSNPPVKYNVNIRNSESILASRCDHDQIEIKDNVVKCLRCPLSWKKD